MVITDRRLNRQDILLWGLLFIVEIIVLLTGITREGVWYDEACSVGIIRHSLAEIWELARVDVHPPLYFYMLKVFSMIFGQSVFVLRGFSALGVLALFSLGIGPVRRICGKTTGLLFSFLVTVTPMYLGMGQEIRMYTWAIFFVTGSVLYAYLAVSENKKSDWLTFGLLMLAAMYTHYYALIAMAVLCGLIAVWFIINPKQFRPMFLVVAGLAALGYLPWALGFLPQLKWIGGGGGEGSGGGGFWIPPLHPGIVWQTLIYPFTYKFFTFDPLAVVNFWAIFGLILWGIGYAVFKHEKATVIYLAAGVHVLTLLAVILYSIFFWPILYVRHLLPVSGLFLLAAAFGLAKLPYKRLVLGFVLLFTALMTPHVIKINQSLFNGPIHEITEYFQQNIQPGDVFIHIGPDTWGVFWYYFPNHKQYIYVAQTNPGLAYCRTFEPTGSGGLDIRGFLEENRPDNVWLITTYIDNDNPAARIFGEESVLESRIFKKLDSWFAVGAYKIKRR